MEEPFSGFPDAVAFFAALGANNERAWFTEQKATYEAAVRRPSEALAAAARPQLEAIAGRPLRARVSRVYRDVRFSKDKSPYHTHQHISFMDTADAGQRHGTGFYLGVDAEQVTLGAGCFDLEGAALDRFRAAVADDTEGGAIAALLADLTRDGYWLHEPALKRVPAPYPSDHPRGELLRRKGLAVWLRITDPARIGGPGLLEEALAAFRRLQPVNRWIGEAVGGRS